MSPSPHCVVTTTTDSSESAQRIARTLIERRLAACVQIVGPITSVYRWQGQVETSQEWQCLAKTVTGRVTDIEHTLIEVHHYDVPELIVTPIEGGSQAYLDWLTAESAESDTP